MTLGAAALFTAIVMAAWAVGLPAMGGLIGFEVPEGIQFYVYTPAAVLGCLAWLRRPSPLRDWPFLFTLAVPIVGLSYGESPVLATNLIVAFYLVGGIWFASLIAERARWRWVARAFVLLNAVLVLMILWMNYRTFGGSLRITLLKFGYIPFANGSASANPNQVGGQLAFATVLGLVVFLRSGRMFAGGPVGFPELTAWACANRGISPFPSPGVSPSDRIRFDRPVNLTEGSGEIAGGFRFGRADWLILLAAGVTGIGCLLTASRGAVLSLVIGAGAVLFGSLGLQPVQRVRDFVVFAVFSLLVGCLIAATLSVNPLQPLSLRLLGEEGTTIMTAGNRLPIWENAVRAWVGDPIRFLIGAGTGGADVALGAVDVGAKYDDNGVIRRSCHNMFLEWIVSYGLVGLLPGLVLALTVWNRATMLDRAERAFDRRGLLLAIIAFGMSAVTYRHLSWLLQAGLTLAFLESDIFRKRRSPFPGDRHPHWSQWQLGLERENGVVPLSQTRRRADIK